MRFKGIERPDLSTSGQKVCPICGEYVDEDASITSPLGRVVCDYHLPVNMRAYSTRNSERKLGAERGLTFSIELETGNTLRHPVAIDLLAEGYIPTPDSSLSGSGAVEWKSPIFSLETYLAEGNQKTLAAVCEIPDAINRSCGTHIHVGVPSRMGPLLLEFWSDLFSPLLTEVMNHPSTTEKVWGRRGNTDPTSGYARMCPPSFSPAPGRYCWINVNGHNANGRGAEGWRAQEIQMKLGAKQAMLADTVEFRLCKMTSLEQYNRLVKWCVSSTTFLLHSMAKMPLSSGLFLSPDGDEDSGLRHLGQILLNSYKEGLVARV